MRRLRSFLPLIVLVAIGVALLSTGALNRLRPQTLASEQAQLQAQIAAHPLRASGLQVGATALAIATGMPGVLVVILAGGMLFGIVAGTLLSSIGLTLGALILFLASRHAFGAQPGTRAPVLVEKLRDGYLAHPVSYTCFLRLVPFFPFGGVTIALAWLRCPLWLFAAATASGGSVITAIETALGAGLARNIAANRAVSLSLFSDPVVIVPLLAMGLLALTPVAIGKWRARRN
ncbi:MAG: TVP38/TMEM64 family protein [Xanthomonadaceae bacterium]|nr:TVP38/TMEM64 family protein [Xanthomonadaceae bacterium]MDE1960192.1 TVP38/TMEM64 family protein [Xanthomonadaceae bacterium]MDE2084574.1 TVP38/TMEM64 family protein [Xanthomonadaceae bacterium]MDE2257623.1 TVP38/TMEM64 family protein [Xanthomonadaceae bacterium]